MNLDVQTGSKLFKNSGSLSYIQIRILIKLTHNCCFSVYVHNLYINTTYLIEIKPQFYRDFEPECSERIRQFLFNADPNPQPCKSPENGEGKDAICLNNLPGNCPLRWITHLVQAVKLQKGREIRFRFWYWWGLILIQILVRASSKKFRTWYRSVYELDINPFPIWYRYGACLDTDPDPEWRILIRAGKSRYGLD